MKQWYALYVFLHSYRDRNRYQIMYSNSFRQQKLCEYIDDFQSFSRTYIDRTTLANFKIEIHIKLYFRGKGQKCWERNLLVVGDYWNHSFSEKEEFRKYGGGGGGGGGGDLLKTEIRKTGVHCLTCIGCWDLRSFVMTGNTSSSEMFTGMEIFFEIQICASAANSSRFLYPSWRDIDNINMLKHGQFTIFSRTFQWGWQRFHMVKKNQERAFCSSITRKHELLPIV